MIHSTIRLPVPKIPQATVQRLIEDPATLPVADTIRQRDFVDKPYFLE